MDIDRPVLVDVFRMTDKAICPDCDAPMHKIFTQLLDGSGRWVAGWACACNKQDWEKHPDARDVTFIHAPPSEIGQAVNTILNGDD